MTKIELPQITESEMIYLLAALPAFEAKARIELRKLPAEMHHALDARGIDPMALVTALCDVVEKFCDGSEIAITVDGVEIVKARGFQV